MPNEPKLTYQNGLTQQEVAVLRLIAQGRRDKEIAKQLSISLNTVHTHVCHILSKLDVGNRGEATAWYWQHKGEVGD